MKGYRLVLLAVLFYIVAFVFFIFVIPVWFPHFVQGSSSFSNFRTEDSAFKEDFSVLPVFVPTDTLDHLKECGKATKKSTPGEAVAEMSSTKGLRLPPFVHDLQASKSQQYYLRTSSVLGTL